jgi:hypothetical protein
MKNGKQPIIPTMYTLFGDGPDDYMPLKDGQKTGWEVKFGGLTKREHFAGLAMQGLLSIYDGITIVPNVDNVKYMAKLAVEAADILLQELETN